MHHTTPYDHYLHGIGVGDDGQTFMEFAVVGVGEEVLSGARPLQNWGQDTEVISRFPSADRDVDAGGGDGDEGVGDNTTVFVEGLADFCFPYGAEISLVGAAAVGAVDYSE